ncbi:hypothetical protein ESY86_01070 [Subsaximicrobium wynnwilliamsii]|uniref:5'-Nucleotidase C-terminal domain-containing protein n=1 Tax=Subsaximicrobium wynnwilliamsii TaxID=291179 RepID=A0A5C6ZMY9_9FLAO|nr:5'-nucleotidase [Subsaximicrobium wynnwilliamsii]TXD85166.1 hypothetical protein ESY87_02240 [Subsaximicrobium wynnwilliamsii]TXD91209.1 hypothetical protein ESY86_01070 [Subsaximicrobium wynnwilliamsii]TXE04603.1 hypothetical protein ESY88_03720 [Subsaximicrobium wynnwilliamsii]
MNYRPLFFVLFILAFSACKTKNHLHKIEGKQINVSDSIAADQRIEAFIKPYRERVEKDLDSVLAYSVATLSKSDGEYNTAIGNMMADAVYEEVNPVFQKRTGKSIDFVLLNHGGIRAIISKGEITTRTAFEVMPFENSIFVAELKGDQIKELIDYLVIEKRAHPISQLKIVLNADGSLKETSSKEKPLNYTKSYFVATNDYLLSGGDRMNFFKVNDSVYDLNYKVRNVLLDYFKKTDTLRPRIDDRFIKIK